MSSQRRALLQVHFCVLLWGFTAIIGKLISLTATALVSWRMLVVALCLLPLPRVIRALRAMSWRLIAAYVGIGVLVALHWLTFYGAIKLANASVGATCIALAPAFLALVEPLINRRRIDRMELLLGVLMVPGVALVVGGIPEDMAVGLWLGVLSALMVALFGSLNKRMVEHGDPLTVTGIELGAGALFLIAIAPLLPGSPSPLPIPDARDVGLLAFLALGCTLLPFALCLHALRQLSAFSAQLAVNLEPVYAILLAIPLLGEQQELGWRFYAGVAVILLLVFAHPALSRRRVQRPAPELLATAEAHGLGDSRQ
ncbi:MAG: DMT family transporter [Xanthomonadales bacterium]|nr:DMT family transporter [Xanthomonadales bacterium]